MWYHHLDNTVSIKKLKINRIVFKTQILMFFKIQNFKNRELFEFKTRYLSGLPSWSQPFSISSHSGRLTIGGTLLSPPLSGHTGHKLDQSDSFGNSEQGQWSKFIWCLTPEELVYAFPANVIPRATVTLVFHSPCYSSVFGSLEEPGHSPDNTLSFSSDFLSQNPGFITYIMSNLTKSLNISVP